MPRTAILAAAIALAPLVAGGCHRPALGAPSWATYTSPDSRVRFDYPSHLEIRVRPPEDDDAPHLALSGCTRDESVQLTLVMRLSDDPMPEYCTRMMDGLADAHTRAVTPRQTISLGGGRGFRQEFREVKGTPVELIAVALDARPAYVHMTCGYTSPAELRSVCERIVGSLTVKK
jgi:hypothetical protein